MKKLSIFLTVFLTVFALSFNAHTQATIRPGFANLIPFSVVEPGNKGYGLHFTYTAQQVSTCSEEGGSLTVLNYPDQSVSVECKLISFSERDFYDIDKRLNRDLILLAFGDGFKLNQNGNRVQPRIQSEIWTQTHSGINRTYTYHIGKKLTCKGPDCSVEKLVQQAKGLSLSKGQTRAFTMWQPHIKRADPGHNSCYPCNDKKDYSRYGGLIPNKDDYDDH